MYNDNRNVWRSLRNIVNLSALRTQNFILRRYDIMKNIDLTKYGISGTTEIVYNPSYDLLLKKRPILLSQVMKKVK